MTQFLECLIPLTALALLIVLQVRKNGPKAIAGILALTLLLLVLSPAPHELALTMCVEALVVFLSARLFRLDAIALTLASLLINTITEPVFAAFLTSMSGSTWMHDYLVGETVVFVFEGFLYIWLLGAPTTKRTVGLAFLISLVANAASGGLGFLLPF